MNSDYDITNVLTPLHEKFCSRGGEQHAKRLLFQVDHMSSATE
jgi:hypothetical protein